MTAAFSRVTACAAGALILTLFCAAVAATASSARGEVIRHGTAGDLFYNYYSPPVGDESVGARLYTCPRPAPPLVGHTYITYQPLMPHEFLYKHHRVYKTQHNDSLRTRTSVFWW